MFKVKNEFRFRDCGELSSQDSDGNNGCFIFDMGAHRIACIASDGGGWEHVSVTAKDDLFIDIVPDWSVMVFVKNQFWGEADTVIQFHPKLSSYVNVHHSCLHLWRKSGENPELPPSNMLG